MSETSIIINFVGGGSVSVSGNSNILYRLKSEEWVEIGVHHIKTSNITHIDVYEGPNKEAQSFLIGEDEPPFQNW